LNRRRGSAFTLIEVLVVVAIVAILAAILFPVFARAKTAAQRTVALSNLKQIGLAWTLYASDFDGVYSPPRTWLGGSKFAYWWASYDEISQVQIPSEGLLFPYSREAGIQADPLWPNRLRRATGATGFGYNYRFLGTGRTTDTSMGSPSETVAFATSARLSFLPPHALEGNAYLDPPSSSYPNYHARANGQGCVVWADAHASVFAPRFRLTVTGGFTPERLRLDNLGDIDRDGDFSTDELFDLE